MAGNDVQEKTSGDHVQFRFADRDDVTAIVALLADDQLGAGRESVAPVDEKGEVDNPYLTAFEHMAAQGFNKYLLAVDAQGELLGCLQLTLIAGLSRAGMTRAQIEGVRVASHARGQRIGQKLFAEAHDVARREGCGLVQLTTDRVRADALRFYEQLGYENTHNGMKLTL